MPRWGPKKYFTNKVCQFHNKLGLHDRNNRFTFQTYDILVLLVHLCNYKLHKKERMMIYLKWSSKDQIPAWKMKGLFGLDRLLWHAWETRMLEISSTGVIFCNCNAFFVLFFSTAYFRFFSFGKKNMGPHLIILFIQWEGKWPWPIITPRFWVLLFLLLLLFIYLSVIFVMILNLPCVSRILSQDFNIQGLRNNKHLYILFSFGMFSFITSFSFH